MIALEKPRYSRALALAAAKQIVAILQPCCERLIVAGSLRRRKETVGDIEFLFVPVSHAEADGLFDTKNILHTDTALERLLTSRVIEKRKNSLGSEVWGAKNKLARHRESGIPLDFFTATPANWFNYLVCRTGSANTNVRLASTAQAKGWKWNPYGVGFTDQEGNLIPVHSEAEVFTLLGLPYLQPWER